MNSEPQHNPLSPQPMTKSTPEVFRQLGLGSCPIMLAPLAGVSDYPFRQICREQGASLVYVEMLSAVALSYYSKNTMAMIHRHVHEDVLGAQITAKDADHMSRGIEVLNQYPLDTIDVNMGCPVKKVVKTGCGSALLRDPEMVYQVVRAACSSTNKVVSAKIRLGWSAHESYPIEVAEACEQAGARWLTVHGRLRSDRYDKPVNLEGIRQIKQVLSIPVIGNGNLFDSDDINHMITTTKVDGVMISRGALGNPWVFQQKTSQRDPHSPLSVTQWLAVITHHIQLSLSLYGDHPTPAIRFRKHLLWYLKGWPITTQVRLKAQSIRSLHEALILSQQIASDLTHQNIRYRKPLSKIPNKWLQEHSSAWDPKFDMDRRLDRGVGEDSHHS